MRRPGPVAALANRALLVAALVFFLAPVAWLVTTAYKPARDVFSYPPTLAFTPTLANFETIFGYLDVGQLVRNSLAISLGTTTLSLLIGVPCGYALARAKWRWAIGVAYGFLAVRMVPPVATLIPFYLLMRDFGLLGTVWAVILIDTTLNAAFVVWMMYAYFRAVAPEVEEAALTDGASQWGAFWRVAVPMVVPGMDASALFCIIFSWNDFLYAAFLTSSDSKPLSVALLLSYGTSVLRDLSWGTMGALAHFSTVPIVILALLLNRYFVQGLTRGVN